MHHLKCEISLRLGRKINLTQFFVYEELTLHLNYLYNKKAYAFFFNFKKSFASLKMAFEVGLIILIPKGVDCDQP